MKKLLSIFFLVLAVSIVYVSAAPNLGMAPSSIYLGESNRNNTITSTFTIENTGNVSLTSIIPYSSFNVEFNATNLNLTVGEKAVIRFNVTIPKESSTGNVTLGNIYFRSVEYNSSNFPVTAVIKGGLIIEDLDVTLTRPDGRSETHTDVINGANLDFGDEDKHEIRPGSTLQFDFRLENLFLDDEDIEIKDVSVLVTIISIDDEEDIDEESEDLDIKPEAKEDFTVTLDIPLKVEEGDYDIEILVKGEDDDGIEHNIEWTLEMRLEKESHDIYIESLSLTKDKLICSGITSLKTKIFNLGKSDEDDVKIEVKNADLELEFEEKGITLSEDPYDEDSEYSKTIPIMIDEGTSAGTYSLDFNVYIKGVVLLKNKKIDLVIEGCNTEEEETKEEVTEEKNEIIIENIAVGETKEEKEETTIPILGQKTTTTEEKLVSGKTIIIISIIATMVIITGIIGVVLMLKTSKH
ncbi:hypothetical protein ISS05_05390 [Candidatus Woesearchaeota archaeon]|nr:hypothetical protein [Candidatus Woesearchaeota archaeon]